jgi:hypothetical protein
LTELLGETCTPYNRRKASPTRRNERHHYPSPGRNRKIPLPSLARHQPKRPHLRYSPRMKKAQSQKKLKKRYLRL